MSDLAVYPMEDGFETTLAQLWNGGVGNVIVNDIPVSTIPASKYTYIVVNPGQSNMQVARVSGWSSTTNKHFVVDDIAVNKGPSTLYTQVSHSANSIVRISNNYQFREDIATAINSKTDSTELGNFTFTNSKATATGDMSFKDDNNAELTLSQLASGSGADQKVAITTNDTTTGVLDSKLTAGDGLKKTVIDPAGSETLDLDIDTADTNVFVKTSSGSGDENKIPVLNASGKVDVFVTAATATAAGIVEMATDIEAAAGTDETRYINSKQAKDNYIMKCDVIHIVRDSAEATATVTYSHGLGKIPKIVQVVSRDSTANATAVCFGTYANSKNYCQYSIVGGSVQNTTNIVFLADGAGSGQRGVLQNLTTTTFDIAWTKAGTPSGNYLLQVSLQA